MIKEVLQQLEPLDAQIDALCSSTDDAEMANTTTHAAELAELSAQENMLLQRCTSLTPVASSCKPFMLPSFLRYGGIFCISGRPMPFHSSCTRRQGARQWRYPTG